MRSSPALWPTAPERQRGRTKNLTCPLIRYPHSAGPGQQLEDQGLGSTFRDQIELIETLSLAWSPEVSRRLDPADFSASETRPSLRDDREGATLSHLR